MPSEKLTIPALLDAVVSRCPQESVFLFRRDNQWQTTSYFVFGDQVRKIASFLIDRNLPQGARVGLALENRPEWAMVYFGIVSAGLVGVPLDARLKPKEIEKYVSDSSARIVFCSREIFENRLSGKLNAETDLWVVADGESDLGDKAIALSEVLANDFPVQPRPMAIGADDAASLIYTSGTTANPKGVVLTHKNIVANFDSIRRMDLCFPQDNFLCFLPLHHTYPFMATLILPVLLGARITFMPSESGPQELANIIRKKEVSVLVAVPQLLAMLRRSVLSTLSQKPLLLRPLVRLFFRAGLRRRFGSQLRLVVSGGARLDEDVARDLIAWGFGLIEGYGLTETAPVVTFNPPDKMKIGSVGRALPGVDVRIDAPDANGIGEIIVRGANVMRGYFRQERLTEEVIRAGWFHTGDLGYLDGDGYLFITGRKKEMIVLSSGKNIYPQELEQHFLQSPYIREICVAEKKDRKFGQESESLFAVIVPDLEYFERSGIQNINDKIRWEVENLSQDLPAYEHIMGFALTRDELPKTALGKLQRYRIKAQYLTDQVQERKGGKTEDEDADVQDLNPEIKEKVIRYLSEQMHRPVSLIQHLEIDLGIDSLTRVELGIGLERLFAIKLSEESLVRLATVKAVVEEVCRRCEQAERSAHFDEQIRQTPWLQILNQEPPEALKSKINLKPRVWDWIVTGFLLVFFNIFFRILWFLRIRRHTPLPQGPYLITPNHASYLDGFFVFCGLPLSVAVNTYFVGWGRIFEHPSIRWGNQLARLVPIDTNTNFIGSMQVVAYLLRKNKVVCIFPEGQRSLSDQIKPFKKGTGILVKELMARVVPVYLKGTGEVWPRTRRWPRLLRPVRVNFGQPLEAALLLKKGERQARDDYEAIAENLRAEVLKLKQIC